MDNAGRTGSLSPTDDDTAQPLDYLQMMHAFVDIYNEYTTKLAEIQDTWQTAGKDALMQIIWQQKQEIASLREKTDSLMKALKRLAEVQSENNTAFDELKQLLRRQNTLIISQQERIDSLLHAVGGLSIQLRETGDTVQDSAGTLRTVEKHLTGKQHPDTDDKIKIKELTTKCKIQEKQIAILKAKLSKIE